MPVALRRELAQRGCLFQSTTDTEVIIHLIATSTFDTVVDRAVAALQLVEGIFSSRIAQRHADRRSRSHGVRPLVLGRFEEAWILASETCVLDIIGVEYVRDIEPGEMVLIDEDGLQSCDRPQSPAQTVHFRIHLLRTALQQH